MRALKTKDKRQMKKEKLDEKTGNIVAVKKCEFMRGMDNF